MRNLLAALAITTAAIAPAHAVQGIWAELEPGWVVQGNTDMEACEAIGDFDNGHSLNMIFGGDTWIFAIGGQNIAPTVGSGLSYAVKVEFDGHVGNLVMRALTNNMLVVAVTDEFVSQMATSHQVTIDDAVTFDLSGSADAIKSTYECQAMLADVADLPTVSNPYKTDNVPEFEWML